VLCTPLLFLLLATAGCGGSGSHAGAEPACTRATQPTLAARAGDPPARPLDDATTYEVVVATNCGSFTIRLDPSTAPHAAASFVALAESGYFDGTSFHRIVPGSLIEAGDPTGSGTGGPGYTTRDAPPADPDYEHGVVAMERPSGAPRGTAGSEFFVVTEAQADLPPDHLVVGRVVDGMDVAEHIGTLGGDSQLPTEVQNTSGLPTRIVVIERASVVRS